MNKTLLWNAERFERNPQGWKKASALLLLIFLAVLPGSAQSAKGKASSTSYQGDFYIISSVNLQKNQILLKLPTEVTEVMRVNEKTVYLDESGKPIHLSDLRAGDTVYIVSEHTADGFLALRIHKGPMTVEILRQRYLGKIP
jgi:hypothetical protein